MSRFLLKVIFGDYQTSQCFQNIPSWMIRLQCVLWRKILWPRHINLKWLFGVSQCFEKTPSCYSADRGESETKLSSPVYKIPPLQIDKYILQFGQIHQGTYNTRGGVGIILWLWLRWGVGVMPGVGVILPLNTSPLLQCNLYYNLPCSKVMSTANCFFAVH